MLNNYPDQTKAVIETAVGGSLLLTPWWAALLSDISVVATTVATVAGAILGAYGVLGLIRGALNAKAAIRKDTRDL